MNVLARFFASAALISLALVGCSAPADDASDADGGSGGSSSDWADKLIQNLDEELAPEVESTTDPTALQTLLCRKADVTNMVFSLRSFDGRLCDDEFVSGLKLVGGGAVLMCWDDDIESFQDSQCAERALAAYGTSKSSLDKAQIVSQMESQASDFVKKAEASGAGALPYYKTTHTIFCKIPTSLLGPGATVHNIWCAPLARTGKTRWEKLLHAALRATLRATLPATRGASVVSTALRPETGIDSVVSAL